MRYEAELRELKREVRSLQGVDHVNVQVQVARVLAKCREYRRLTTCEQTTLSVYGEPAPAPIVTARPVAVVAAKTSTLDERYEMTGWEYTLFLARQSAA